MFFVCLFLLKKIVTIKESVGVPGEFHTLAKMAPGGGSYTKLVKTTDMEG